MTLRADELAGVQASAAARRPALVSVRSGELALLATLFLVAAVVRYPELWNIPRFTDETDDVLYSVAIYRGLIFPLTNFNTYNSALFNYLTAGLFWLFGLSVYLPRLLVFLLGSLAVPATYLLGKAFGGRLAGLIAAALLATSVVHVTVNSHVSWSNCTTPLLTTLALWALCKAVGRAPLAPLSAHPNPGGFKNPPGLELEGRGARGANWALAGLLFGLALQTHPSVLLMLPGAGLFVVWRNRGVLRTPGPWLGLALFLIGYSPMILFNLQTGFASTDEATAKQQQYVRGQQTSAGAYLDRLGDELVTLPALLGSTPVDAADRIVARAYDPRLWLGGGLALAGLAYAARRGNPLPLLVAVPYLLALPVLNAKYERIVDGRYLGPLIPLVYGAIGWMLADLVRRLGRRPATAPAAAGRWRWPSWAAGAGIAVLVLLPLVSLSGYYRAARSTSAPVLDALGAVRRTIQPSERVVVDSDLALAEKTGDGRLERIFRAIFASAGLPYVVVDTSKEWLTDELAAADSTLLIVDPGKARRLQGDFRLEPLARASQVSSTVVFDFLTMRVTPTQAVAPRAVPPGAEASRPARPRADKYRPLNSSEEARGRIPE